MRFLEGITGNRCFHFTNPADDAPRFLVANPTSSWIRKSFMVPWELNSRRKRLSIAMAQQSIPTQGESQRKRCLRCNNYYVDKDNGPHACFYHGHMNGDRGLFSMAPPHQGIDGEWTDASGVIVYKWNDRDNRPNTGRSNWKKRWSCCGEYDDKAPPCRSGWHVSYDDGATLF